MGRQRRNHETSLQQSFERCSLLFTRGLIRERNRWWQKPPLVIAPRNVCGPCGVENSTLVMHPDPKHLYLREEFQNRRDAEVIGQICSVVRKLWMGAGHDSRQA